MKYLHFKLSFPIYVLCTDPKYITLVPLYMTSSTCDTDDILPSLHPITSVILPSEFTRKIIPIFLNGFLRLIGNCDGFYLFSVF